MHHVWEPEETEAANLGLKRNRTLALSAIDDIDYKIRVLYMFWEVKKKIKMGKDLEHHKIITWNSHNWKIELKLNT